MTTLTERMIQELAVTAELCGTDLSDAAARVICAELANYPEAAVLAALSRLRREHNGRLTLAAIISRIDDGRPGPEEAWSLYPKDDYATAVVTNEVQEAMGSARPLLSAGDKIGARMAFKEAYERIVAENRAKGAPPRWEVTLGWDKAGRAPGLAEAVKRQRIGMDQAMKYLSGDEQRQLLESAGVADHPLLAPPTQGQIKNQERLAQLLETVSPGVSRE